MSMFDYLRREPELKPEFRAPNHLHRYAALETECRAEHMLTRTVDHKARLATTQKVVEAVWAEGFNAGAAHALATMSVRYIVVTAEEKAAMIAKIEQESA